MSFSDYLRLAQRYVVVLVCLPLVTGVAGFASARSQAMVYRSTAQGSRTRTALCKLRPALPVAQMCAGRLPRPLVP
jgi:hypothetical protein